MPKDKISDYDSTASNNTDVGGVGIVGSVNTISNVDDAAREIMSHLADMNAGTSPLDDTFCVADPADATKKARIDAGNVTAGQTRVLTMPDQDITAFGLAGEETKTADYTVVAGDTYKTIVLTGSTARTFTLPALSAVTNTDVFLFKNDSSALLTISRAGSDTIDGGLTSFILTPDQGIALREINGEWREFPGRGTLPLRDEVLLSTAVAYGSTATRIVRFSSTATANSNGSLTVTQSSSDGDSVTVNVTGLYAIVASCEMSDVDREWGVTRNQSDLTANITSIPGDQVIATDSGTASRRSSVGATVWLEAAEVIRICTDGGTLSTVSNDAQLRLTRVT
jgi:hypothetical protein